MILQSILWLTATLIVFTSCTGEGLVGTSNQQQGKSGADIAIDSGSEKLNRSGRDAAADDTTKAARHPDTNKPTDDSEGIPGYLVDPKLIAVLTQDDGSRDIVGKAGGYDPADEKTSLSAYAVERSEFETITAVTGSVPVTFLGTTTIEADGSFQIEVSLVSTDQYILVDGRGLGKVAQLTLNPEQGTISYAHGLLHEHFYDFDERRATTGSEAGFSLYCARGKAAGNNTEEIFMVNFPDQIDYKCGACDPAIPLGVDHPLADVVTDGYGCKLQPASTPNIEPVGFFLTDGGNCSKVGTRCNILNEQPFLGTIAMLQGQFVTAPSRRSAFEATSSCSSYFGGSLLDLVTQNDADGIQCNGFNKVPLTDDLSGCRVPPSGGSLLEATICSKKSLQKIFRRESTDSCHFLIERPIESCD